MSTIAAAGVVDRDRESSMRWAVVGLLSLGMVIAYIDRVNLTAAMPVIGSTVRSRQDAAGARAIGVFLDIYAVPDSLRPAGGSLRRAHALLHRVPCVVGGVGRDRDDLGADVARGSAADSRDGRRRGDAVQHALHLAAFRGEAARARGRPVHDGHKAWPGRGISVVGLPGDEFRMAEHVRHGRGRVAAMADSVDVVGEEHRYRRSAEGATAGGAEEELCRSANCSPVP